MFKKFNSIEGLKQRQVSQVQYEGLDNVDREWYWSEKVDGANFSFIVDDVKNPIVVAGKRNGLVGDKFYNCQPVIEKYTERVVNLANFLNDESEKIKSVIIYGELYGQGVQKRIDYRPDQDFIAFDIHILNTDDQWEQLSITSIKLLCYMFFIDFTPFHGPYTFSEILEEIQEGESLDVEIMKSEVALKADCAIEGIVIRPNDNLFFNNGKRVQFKIKTKAFLEGKNKNKVTKEIVTSDLFKVISAEIPNYVTENRFLSAESKIGPCEPSLIGEFIKEISQDIHADMLDDIDRIKELENKEFGLLRKLVTQQVASQVKGKVL